MTNISIHVRENEKAEVSIKDIEYTNSRLETKKVKRFKLYLDLSEITIFFESQNVESEFMKNLVAAVKEYENDKI